MIFQNIDKEIEVLTLKVDNMIMMSRAIQARQRMRMMKNSSL